MEALTIEGETQGALLRPYRRSGLGILVLTGASGRVDAERARLFARHGAVAFAQRWWGGAGQAPGICEIPLETFFRGVDRLVAEGCERVAVLGVSRGSEAALLTAIHDGRVGAAIAVSPSHVVWTNIGPGLDGELWPARSAWTLAGEPLPFVAWDPRWRKPAAQPTEFLGLHEKSLAAFAEDVPAATIPVERARAEVLLIAGGADALWPSAPAARAIAQRCAAAGKAVRIVEHPAAGHRPVFPGEPLTPRPADRAWGGADAADQALGAAAWREIEALLDLTCDLPREPPRGGYRPASGRGIRFHCL